MLTADQLLALNDEIAALARAGVPLEQGLSHLGKDLPGRLGRAMRSIAGRIEQGVPLERALADEGLPPAYHAVIAAGIRSGRLAVALEGMATLIRRAAETHRLAALALVYPVFVLVLAYALLLASATYSFPTIVAAYRGLTLSSEPVLWLDWLAENATATLPWLPLLLVAALTTWWWRSRQAWRIEGRLRSANWPSIAGVLFAGRMATFAEVLALLVEHRVPLPEAIRLAADACGDRRLQAVGGKLADKIASGQTLDFRAEAAALPPLLGWLIAAPCGTAGLERSLRRAADSYRRQAWSMARWLSVYLPIWLTVLVGGTATAAYAVILILPWSFALKRLAMPE